MRRKNYCVSWIVNRRKTEIKQKEEKMKKFLVKLFFILLSMFFVEGLFYENSLASSYEFFQIPSLKMEFSQDNSYLERQLIGVWVGKDRLGKMIFVINKINPYTGYVSIYLVSSHKQIASQVVVTEKMQRKLYRRGKALWFYFKGGGQSSNGSGSAGMFVFRNRLLRFSKSGESMILHKVSLLLAKGFINNKFPIKSIMSTKNKAPTIYSGVFPENLFSNSPNTQQVKLLIGDEIVSHARLVILSIHIHKDFDLYFWSSCFAKRYNKLLTWRSVSQPIRYEFNMNTHILVRAKVVETSFGKSIRKDRAKMILIQ